MLSRYSNYWQPAHIFPLIEYIVPAPLNIASVSKRSATVFMSLDKIEWTLKRMFPEGYKDGTLYYVRGGCVALEVTMSPCGRLQMDAGWWISGNGEYGRDLISLYAVVNRSTYDLATTALFDALKSGQSDNVRLSGRLKQELHPLHKENYSAPVYGWPYREDVCYFRNSVGKIIATLTRLRTSSGENANVYMTLWRRNDCVHSQWAPIFPKTPIFYNRDVLESYPSDPVWISKEPFDGVERERNSDSWIYTALPNGPSDLLKVDLNFLEKRRIHLDLDHEALEHVLQLHKALSIELGCSVTYSYLNSGMCEFKGICQVASNAKIVVKGLRAEQESALKTQVLISGPGGRVHGSDFDRQMLLTPFLKEGYLVWLYAPEKSGKSWLATAIAHVVASGEGRIGNWSSEQKVDVLLVDGEMQPDELDNIIAQTIRGSRGDYRGPTFSVLCAKSQSSGVIDLTEELWQNEVEKNLKGKKLLILDNLQSVTRDGGARIDNLQPWLRRITQKGIAVIILDHSNAEGDLQGSIAKKRIADVVIKMTPVNDEGRSDNQVTISYEAGRSLFGKDAEPFGLKRLYGEGTVRYELADTFEDKQVQKIDERTQRMALVVFAKDDRKMTYAQIREAYNIARSTAQNLYSASCKLVGVDLEKFKQELQRLRSEKG
ncbi:AAA family ATPase [Terasakiella pusilla]|uniref:AAA family ATPase n=1 Tax=Terasakiella pusilla TaxID=64973 RepID=UPI003AA8931B